MTRAKYDRVLGYGMGVESTALLLAWLSDPDAHGVDPSRLLLVTAVTGNEYSSTHAAVARYIVPRLEASGVRWVQVARGGQRQESGYDILSDAVGGRVATRGRWHLGQDSVTGGTVVQVAGVRKCALKAKGWPLDSWIRDHLAGEFEHAIGFNAGEADRIEKDSACYGMAPGRRPIYPLRDWGWFREDCERFIREQLGISWMKSCCIFCPFQPVSVEKGAATAERWRGQPEEAVQTLITEFAALALNPRAKTFKDLSATAFVERFGLEQIRRGADERLATMPWNVLEVRRVIPPRAEDPTRKAQAWRSVHIITTTDRDEARRQVGRLAELLKAELEDDEHGIRRAWVRRAGEMPPVIEHFYAAAPAGAEAKERKNFERTWNTWARRPEGPLIEV